MQVGRLDVQGPNRIMRHWLYAKFNWIMRSNRLHNILVIDDVPNVVVSVDWCGMRSVEYIVCVWIYNQFYRHCV
jgi:hypothetical protein